MRAAIVLALALFGCSAASEPQLTPANPPKVCVDASSAAMLHLKSADMYIRNAGSMMQPIRDGRGFSDPAGLVPFFQRHAALEQQRAQIAFGVIAAEGCCAWSQTCPVSALTSMPPAVELATR